MAVVKIEQLQARYNETTNREERKELEKLAAIENAKEELCKELLQELPVGPKWIFETMQYMKADIRGY